MTDIAAQNANREAMLDRSDRHLDTTQNTTTKIHWYVSTAFNQDGTITRYTHPTGKLDEMVAQPDL